MPELEDISYSLDETIAAFRDYFDFLTSMYLDDSDITEPPAGGWPSVRANGHILGKTEEVVTLLSHLPYVHTEGVQGSPKCRWADWQELLEYANEQDGERLRVMSENAANFDREVPSHVIGLTYGGRDNPVFLLDTKLGIITWWECPDRIKDDPLFDPVQDDEYDYAPELEAEWRAEGESWPIADFFSILKDQFTRLNYIPLERNYVVDAYIFATSTSPQRTEDFVPIVRDIYRQYNWPDLTTYRKRECLEAVDKAWQEFQAILDAEWREQTWI